MHRRLFAFFMASCLLFSGCTLQRMKNNSEDTKSSNSIHAEPSAAKDEPAAPSEFSTSGGADDVQIVEDPNAGFELPTVTSMGDVAFESDTLKAVSGEIGAGKELTLEATDASGAVWTLTVPANAVPIGTQIKMTPLKNIRSDGYIGSMKGGMLFEPDGLEFDIPGTLSIKLPEGTSTAVMITGDNQGKGLNLMDGEPAEGTVTSTIEHFSSAYFDTVESLDMQRLQEQAESDYTETVRQLKEFLKTPIQIPPVQELTLECLSDKRYTQARIYAYRAMQPEMDYARALAQAGRKMHLLGSEKGSEESLNYLTQIAERLVKKGTRIYKECGEDPNKFLAGSIAVLSCYRNAHFMTADLEVPGPAEAIGAYAGKTADYCLSKIRDDHNFKYIRAAFEVGRLSAMLGNENSVREVIDALTFKLEYTLTFNILLGDEQQSWTAASVIKGEADITYDTKFSGTGNGNYEQLTSNYMGMSAEPFDFNVEISKFDPCETETAVLNFSALTAQSETCWLLTDPSAKAQDPYIKKFVDQLIPPTGGQYVLSLPLKNGEAVVCDDVVRKESQYELGAMSVDISVKLTHTPK